jgi:hypothetical protein
MSGVEIKIEVLELNCIRISSCFNRDVVYDLNKWTLGEAVEDYVEGELDYE